MQEIKSYLYFWPFVGYGHFSSFHHCSTSISDAGGDSVVVVRSIFAHIWSLDSCFKTWFYGVVLGILPDFFFFGGGGRGGGSSFVLDSC